MKQYKEHGVAFKNIKTGEITRDTFMANSEVNALIYFRECYRNGIYRVLEVIEL